MSVPPDEAAAPPRRRTDWDRLTAIAAILIGLVAVAVAAYTAFIQRQQVSAQVWPYLLVGSYDTDHAVKALNKGVGPALVRNVKLTVDGKPQRSWKQVLATLGLPDHGYEISTLSGNVLSPGESCR
jgi:predicted hotdog family 3-hydroxylacyl-ACP dehydratase